MAKLAISLALVLVMTSVQCVAVCAAPAKPACPHHQKSTDGCSHELIYLQTVAISPEPAVETHLKIAIAFVESPAPPADMAARSLSVPLRL